MNRSEALWIIANRVPVASSESAVRIAIDGVDGAGKTIFGDQLADTLREQGRTVVRASVDDFHNRREIRYKKGRTSPEGFWLDSYDYERFIHELLDPFGNGRGAMFCRAIHDVHAEREVDSPLEVVPAGGVLLVDGIFLHRDELVAFWDFSVFLDVDFDVSVGRMALRDNCSPDPDAEQNRRYVEGQRIYLATCDPRSRANVVVDNTDFDRPRLVWLFGF